MNYKNVELYNVQEMIESEKGESKLLTRLPDELRVTLNNSAKNCALHTAGCEIRFNLKSEKVKIVLEAEEEASCLKDLVEELKYYHADFLNFLSELNMDVPIKDLETIKIPKKKIEKDIKPIKKKRKMLRRKKK